MRPNETRKCPLCKHTMHMMDGSDKTVRDKVYFTLRCRCCGHKEMDWYERKNGKPL